MRKKTINSNAFNITLERAAQLALIGLFFLALIYALYFGAAILLPVFFAALISILLRPMVRAARKLKIPDAVSAGLVLILLLVVLAAGVNRLLEPASRWIERAPQAMQDVRDKLGNLTEQLETAQDASEQLENLTTNESADDPVPVVVRGPTLIERSMSYTWVGITQLVLTFTLLYFFLALGPATLDGSLKLFPLEQQRQFMRDLVSAVQGQLTAYLRALALIYACLGFLTGVAMYLLGMPNPILWGAMAFILGFIPYVGPAITLIVISLVAFISFESLGDIVKPILAYGVLTMVEGFFVTPNVLGRRLTLSPFAILLSIVFWSWIWGFTGTVLAVPILASIKLVVDHAAGLRSVEQAAGEYAPTPDDEDETAALDGVESAA